MAEIQLRCHVYSKSKGFKNLEEVAKKGWVTKHQEHGWDIAYCPKCKKKKYRKPNSHSPLFFLLSPAVWEVYTGSCK